MTMSKRDVTMPPLPAFLHSQAGPVPVDVRRNVKYDGTVVFGRFSSWERKVYVNETPHEFMQHQTLYHEWMHMVLFDAGLNNIFTKDQQELLCDIVGTARAVEIREAAKAAQTGKKGR